MEQAKARVGWLSLRLHNEQKSTAAARRLAENFKKKLAKAEDQIRVIGAQPNNTESNNIGQAPNSDRPEAVGLALLSEALKPLPFILYLLPQEQVVLGCSGTNYTVRFPARNSRSPISFELREYTFEKELTDFEARLKDFNTIVLEPLAKYRSFDVFARGTADAKDYKGKLDINNKYASVAALTQGSNDIYGPRVEERPFKDDFINADLPFLRAEYTKRVAKRVLPQLNVENLASRLLPRDVGTRFAVEFLLCVRA